MSVKNFDPAEFVFKFAKLNTGNGIIELLAEFAYSAAVYNHYIILVAELAYGRNNRRCAGAPAFFELAAFLSLNKLVNAYLAFLNVKSPVFADFNYRVTGNAGQN